MLDLIKLEWRKHRMARYFTNFFSCVIGIYGFVAFISLASKNDVDGAMGSFQEFMSLIQIFSNITFIILGSVILSRLIISEFRTKTMQVLFTYPIKRQKILFAKLMLAYLFTTGCLFVGIWLMQIITYFLQPSLGLFEGTVTPQGLWATLPNTVTNAFMMGAISLIPLFFGMRKKSTATTITSAVIIAFLMNSTVSNGGASFSLANVVIIPIILALCGIGIAYLSFRNIDVKDVA
ncbi:ABC-type transport system involved in multi-copper enzyme maturation permease subunit [Bacillus thermophilus]|uniref:ABC-type transport system involved in multi-copper enzyme maturation permease subunit n=1 Tax=Siminovitchia thermophila TaxID=1245522 RepID=A0ABS2R301_9BACI|nr:ABC transporter permease [Siminovitchia thermophila]MBM7713514.1 ABC-type transport system involved in multi-copper enzyme maturation permease subunit [Siminovitchia thermophila]